MLLEEELGDTTVDILNKKDLFRRAAEAKLIQDPKAWFSYHNTRNITLHTYDDEDNAEKVFQNTKPFLKDAKSLSAELEGRLNRAS